MDRPTSWKGLLLEAVAIMFSVLFALGINEWRDARKQRQTVAAALQSIRNEIESNHRVLSDRTGYYSALSDTIAWMRAQPEDAAPGEIPGWRGLSPPLLRDASYQAAIATQAFSNMDYATADRLAQVYAFQDLYAVLMDKSMDRIITPPEETLAEIQGMFRELGQIGAELEGVYRDVLEHLPAGPGEAAW